MTLDDIQEKQDQGDFGKTDWERLDAMTDEDIETAVKNDPDAAPLADDDFWKNATVVLPKTKVDIHIRMDADIVDFFKKSGSGYQTRMNAVLRSYVDAHRHK